MAAITRFPIGTRSIAPHSAPPASAPVANAPASARRVAAKARRMWMMPSSQNTAMPSMALVRTVMVRSRAGMTEVLRDIALERAGVAEPVPAAGRAAHDAEAVISLETCVRVAPLFAGHLAAAAGREHAAFCVGRQLRKETRDVGGGADKTGGRREGMGRIVAGNDKAPARGMLGAVAARERQAFAACGGHVGRRFRAGPRP